MALGWVIYGHQAFHVASDQVREENGEIMHHLPQLDRLHVPVQLSRQRNEDTYQGQHQLCPTREYGLCPETLAAPSSFPPAMQQVDSLGLRNM